MEDTTTNEPKPIPIPEYFVRVKLPPPIPNEDGYDAARSDAIFAAKPPGYEVIWEREGWPWAIDSEGRSCVTLRLDDPKSALAYYQEQCRVIGRRLANTLDTIRGLV